MKASPEIALDGTVRRDGSRRLVLEIVVWLAAFALLLCQPAERAADEAGKAGPVPVAGSR